MDEFKELSGKFIYQTKASKVRNINGVIKKITSDRELFIYERVLSKENIDLWFNKYKKNETNLPELLQKKTYTKLNTHTIFIKNYGETVCNIRDLNNNILNKIYYGVLNALEYLHTFNYLHNDVKPSNILIDSNDRITLIDFDITVKHNTSFNKFVGTINFSSISSHELACITYKDDIESLGYTLFFLKYKYMPWNSQNQILNNNVVYKKKIKFKKEFMNIVQIKLLKLLFMYVYSLNKYDIINYNYLQSLDFNSSL